jgi:hypothetical protein
MSEDKRYTIGTWGILVALAFAAGLFVANVTVGQDWTVRPAEYLTPPADEVGSGLHLPLGGAR